MLSSPRLYAVVDRTTPAPAHKRNIAELRASKNQELQGKKAIDRAAAVLDRLEARVVAYKLQIAALQKRKALAESRIERYEDKISTRMQSARVRKADGFQITFSLKAAPPAVDVFDEAAVPAEYGREKTTTTPDKNAIKAALLAGVEVAGCRLTQKETLQRK